MKTIYLSSAYWAPVDYYVQLCKADCARIERYDHYMKQTYRNRCVIASAGGPLALTVPTEKGETDKVLMKDVRISDHGHWRHVHWNALEAAYRHSPFFEYYADDFRGFYEKKYTFLWDLNLEICATVCRLIDIHPRLEGTEDYQAQPTDGEDFREAFHPKRNLPETEVRPYWQVFQDRYGFLPHLSIADLLFCMGPESILMI